MNNIEINIYPLFQERGFIWKTQSYLPGIWLPFHEHENEWGRWSATKPLVTAPHLTPADGME